jgi:hypothetical protein
MKILQPSHAARDPSASGAPIARPIASGDGWSLAEYVCGAGPGSPSFEERHGAFTVAAVLEGLFRYRTDTGTALLHPGALLLGNFGTCFECGHDHSRGDRCVALHLAPEYFGEIAASISGTAGFRFRGAMLPAHAGTLPWFAHIEASLAYGDRCEIEETASNLSRPWPR